MCVFIGGLFFFNFTFNFSPDILLIGVIGIILPVILFFFQDFKKEDIIKNILYENIEEENSYWKNNNWRCLSKNKIKKEMKKYID